MVSAPPVESPVIIKTTFMYSTPGELAVDIFYEKLQQAAYLKRGSVWIMLREFSGLRGQFWERRYA